MLKAYRVKNGIVTPPAIEEGEIILDFRGEKWMFLSIMPDGGTYKVYARKPGDPRSHRFFFPSVFALEVRQDGSLRS